MPSVTGYLVLTLVTVKVLLADESLFSSDIFLDDSEPVSDLSFAFTDPPGPRADELFRNENAPDLSSDQLFAFANPADTTNSIDFDYFGPDEVPEYWDDGLTALSADADHPDCDSSESQLPARLRARAGTCAAFPTIDTPVVIDLLNPKLKLKPICPMVEFPALLIAVCSSGNPLDEWGPPDNVLLYDSSQGGSICIPWLLHGVRKHESRY